VFRDLRAFVLEAARANDRLRLVLDAHVSLAFAVGTVLDVKCGKAIEIEQRTGGRRFWCMDCPGTPSFTQLGDTQFYAPVVQAVFLSPPWPGESEAGCFSSPSSSRSR
jgi:hypothetical protein